MRTAVVSLLTVVTIASLAGTALSPYLLVKSPLLLVALSPAAHHVALAAASVDPAPLIAVATLRRVLTAVGAYGLGYFYGRAALGWLDERHPRLARLVTWLETQLKRFGVLTLVIAPAPVLALLAGAAQIHFAQAVVALLVGHTLWNSATYYFGDAAARWTDLLTAYLDENLLEATLICLLAVLLQQAVALVLRRRKQRAA